MNIKDILGLDLMFTVRARIEIGALAGHSMQSFFDELAKGNEEKSINLEISALQIMHNAYLRHKALDEGKEFEPVEFNKEDFLDLTNSEWGQIENLLVEVIKRDSDTEVQTTSKKKEESQN